MKLNLREVCQQRRGWSLYKLAREIGVKDKTLARWFKAKHPPSWAVLDKLCDVLGCEPGELFKR